MTAKRHKAQFVFCEILTISAKYKIEPQTERKTEKSSFCPIYNETCVRCFAQILSAVFPKRE